MLEVSITVLVLSMVLVMVAQMAVSSARARRESAHRQLAQELANNAVERARAVPWEELSQEWGDRQHISEEVAEYLPAGRLDVTVSSDEKLPVKHVTAVVSWELRPSVPRLETRFSTLIGRPPPPRPAPKRMIERVDPQKYDGKTPANGQKGALP